MMNFLARYRARFAAAGRKRGFTLLIAVLVASLMLILASSIFDLVEKEVILSSLGRDSEDAFYTADSALECALYWDFQQQAFSNPSGGPSIVCNGTQASGPITYGGVEDPMTYQYENTSVSDSPHCVKVTVTKHATNPKTTINAYGYNVSCSVLAAGSDERALERAVEVNY
ncbi:MAG TPA: hypothetical protein VFL98_03375 [Candidatus Paceibacterota bacterium]|nr:hypothetical protein [Candidatus Paceibacterota bacterium]